MTYRVTVSHPGCLPDGDAYPYEVDEDEESLCDAVKKELDLCYGEDPVDGAEVRLRAQANQLVSELSNGQVSAWSLDLPDGDYVLTVEHVA
jgi:hypothetical protein